MFLATFDTADLIDSVLCALSLKVLLSLVSKYRLLLDAHHTTFSQHKVYTAVFQTKQIQNILPITTKMHFSFLSTLTLLTSPIQQIIISLMERGPACSFAI